MYVWTGGVGGSTYGSRPSEPSIYPGFPRFYNRLGTESVSRFQAKNHDDLKKNRPKHTVVFRISDSTLYAFWPRILKTTPDFGLDL